MTAPPVTATTTPDLHALRSAQLRADRHQRESHLFSRSLLAFIGIAAVIAVALLFGRSYLFPTEWNATLTPIVDEIQQERGADFGSTVPLTVLPADQYADEVLAATVGDDWAVQLPLWRAAGLADGAASTDRVAAALAERLPVVYDAQSDTIYQLADADAERVTAELRIVLADVFDLQRDGEVASRTPAAESRFAGVSSPSYIAQRAVEVYLAGGRTASESPVDAGAEPEAPADADAADPVSSLPLPIQYELDAIDLLGEAALVGANIDPLSASRGVAYPVATVLDDGAMRTAAGLVSPEERSLGEPIALGIDDWSLVWGAYLPSSTVEQLAAIVTADSFRPIDRAGTTCFLGVFQTATETDGAQLLSAMTRWAEATPVGSQALATELGPMRVQLEACDPGEAATGPTEAPVAGLITRQVERLAR